MTARPPLLLACPLSHCQPVLHWLKLILMSGTAPLARPILIRVISKQLIKMQTRDTGLEFERVTGFRWRSDKNPSGVAPQTHHQQFDSVYATHPVTFYRGTVPGCRKSATPRQNTSSSAPFKAWEEQGVHPDFLPVSSLLLAVVTLETAVSRYLHLACI